MWDRIIKGNPEHKTKAEQERIKALVLQGIEKDRAEELIQIEIELSARETEIKEIIDLRCKEIERGV